VQPLDRTPWLEQPSLHREVLFLRAAIDPGDHVVVRAGIGFDGRPAPIQEHPHRDAASGGVERPFEERIGRVPPAVLDVERFDREPLVRGSQEI